MPLCSVRPKWSAPFQLSWRFQAGRPVRPWREGTGMWSSTAARLGRACVVVLAGMAAAALAQATPAEMQARDQWVAARFSGEAASLPISFTLGGVPSATVLKTWKVERAERKLDENRTEIVLTASDPAGGLGVRCVAVRYRDYPAIEWTPYFKNTGREDTPIIADIRALDATFERAAPGGFELDHAKGSTTEPNSYEPRTTQLGKGQRSLRLATSGGRSSHSTMPYWKLSWGGAGRCSPWAGRDNGPRTLRAWVTPGCASAPDRS